MGERRGRVIKEHVYRTHGQSQRRDRTEGRRQGYVGWVRELGGNGDNCT